MAEDDMAPDAAQAPAGAASEGEAVAEGRAGEAEGRVAQDDTAPAGAASEGEAVAEGRAGEPEGRVAQDDTAEGRAGEPEGRVAQISRANPRKLREGIVTSAAMDKTAVVTVTERVRHRLYGKTVQRSTKLYVHDEANECNQGDRVRVQETRPLSKQKRWRLVEIVERAR